MEAWSFATNGDGSFRTPTRTAKLSGVDPTATVQPGMGQPHTRATASGSGGHTVASSWVRRARRIRNVPPVNRYSGPWWSPVVGPPADSPETTPTVLRPQHGQGTVGGAARTRRAAPDH